MHISYGCVWIGLDWFGAALKQRRSTIALSLSDFLLLTMNLLCSRSVLPLNMRQQCVWCKVQIVVFDRILICVSVAQVNNQIHGACFKCPIQSPNTQYV